MADILNVLPYQVGGRYLGIPLERVVKVVRAAEITALPEVPATVAGMLNIQGAVVPVVDMRLKVGVPHRPVALSDIFIVVSGDRGVLALWVDSVDSAQRFTASDLATSGELLEDLDFVRAVVEYRQELLVVHDVEDFLALEHAALKLARLARNGRG
jgi:purine-binding chemotaxis protein CheW